MDPHLPWPVAITVYCEETAAGKEDRGNCALGALSEADQRAPGACKFRVAGKEGKIEIKEEASQLKIKYCMTEIHSSSISKILNPTGTRITHEKDDSVFRQA